MHNKGVARFLYGGGSASPVAVGWHFGRSALPASAFALCGVVLLLTGCAPGDRTGTFTILDNGTGAQLCDEVMESYPPQCNGTPVIDWSWEGLPHDEAQGVRWGTYTLNVQTEGDQVRVEVLAES